MTPLTGTLSKGWLAKHIGVSFDRDYYFDPVKRHKIDALCNEYAKNSLADLDIFYSESNLGQFEHFSDNQVLVGGIQPNMILGMLIGADFVPADARDADISATPLQARDDNETSVKQQTFFIAITPLSQQGKQHSTNGGKIKCLVKRDFLPLCSLFFLSALLTRTRRQNRRSRTGN